MNTQILCIKMTTGYVLYMCVCMYIYKHKHILNTTGMNIAFLSHKMLVNRNKGMST